MKDKQKIPVFYACDDNFVKYTIVSLKSMMENASREYGYRIHILHTGICGEMKRVVSSMADENFEICFVDVTEYLKSISGRLPLRDYYSKTTYFRMFIAQLFPEYEKAIYIDSDTVVLGDISALYETNLEDAYVGAVLDKAVQSLDIFAEYVEKVVGIERNNYFNAGLLVINCNLFRKNKVLDQFLELLHVYNFVVAQDEDYLNLICQGHVHWLPYQWNAQVFGEIPCPPETVQVLHYIMVSKPWHYEDCVLGEYFWKYAKETPVYGEIREVLAGYTDEQRRADAASAERLQQIAEDEIARENNYLNLKNSGRLKAKDRLEVLERIAKLEREGRFDVDVEEDPPARELYPDEIDYLRKKIVSKIKRKLTYTVARSYMNTILEHKQMIVRDIKGIEHFRNLTSGAVITCNHFNAFDSFAIQLAYEAAHQKHRKFYRVIREGNYTSFPGFYGMLMRNCNTFPLSSNKNTMEKFIRCMDIVLKRGDFVLVYPEQSMWWNYRKPKPLKKGAFTFAATSGVPVLPCFITMEDSDILGDDGFYVQEYTIHIAEPIYPDTQKNRAQNVKMMMEKNFEIWKQIYEDTYGVPLTYTCDEKEVG